MTGLHVSWPKIDTNCDIMLVFATVHRTGYRSTNPKHELSSGSITLGSRTHKASKRARSTEPKLKREQITECTHIYLFLRA